MTALKYALYTGGGALINFALSNVIPSMGTEYAVWTPFFGMILKSIGTWFATQAADIKDDDVI